MRHSVFAVFLLSIAAAPAVLAQSTHASTATGAVMTHATGTFDVKVLPQTASDIATAGDLGRMTIDKTWSGDITGASKGEMLTGMTQTTGGMSYVALERMAVTVGGRTGTFLLRHSATMLQGDTTSGSMDIAAVENSGTGELAGIHGTLRIEIVAGVHRYDFAYTLPLSKQP